MANARRTRLRVEVCTAVASAVLGIVTLFWRDWIEVVFRVDPDEGSGSFEWFIVAALAAVAVGAAVLARWEWQRIRRAVA